MSGRGDQISVHEVRAYLLLKDSKEWLTAQDVARLAGFQKRTARNHCAAFVAQGVAEQIKAHPGYRYHWAAPAGHPYVARLEAAREALQGLLTSQGILSS